MKNSFTHGGIKEAVRLLKLKEDNIIDFSANINPLGLPRGIEKTIKDNIKNILHYPDPENTELKMALSKYLNLSNKNIIVGNGSTELIYLTVYALMPKRALIVSPSFSEYEKALLSIDAKIKHLRLKEKDEFNIPIKEIIERLDEIELIFLCNPNNPTGKVISRDDMVYLLKKLRGKGITLILDEAFIDMVEENSLIALAPKNNNLLILRSLTKFFGLPGLRLGYGVGTKGLIKILENFRQPWSVNIFAQAIGAKLIQDEEFKRTSKEVLLKEKEFLYQGLCKIEEIVPYCSYANFILVKILTSLSSERLQRRLLKKGILIRDCSNFRGLNNKFIRIAVRSRRENSKLINELRFIFSGG